MTSILAGMTEVTTAVLGVVTSTVTTIVGQPLLLIPVLIGFIGFGIKLFKSIRKA